MASEYTEHFNLDLYTDDDRPNLRDQYNAAIRKIDNKLFEQVTTINLLDSIVDDVKADTEQVITDLQTEVTARTNADTALGTRIDNEVTARESADQTLTTNLAAEVTAREGADTTLDNKITAETTARTNADTALGDRMDTVEETVDGFAGDIQDEVTARTNADTSLGTRIDTITHNLDRDMAFRGILLTIGDSWLGGGYNDDNGYHDGSATINWGAQLEKRFNFEHRWHYSQGASGYAQIASNGKNFLTRLQDSINEHSEEERLKVSAIVIGDGSNDANESNATKATITTNINQMVTLINQYYPNARVYIFPTMSCPLQVSAGKMSRYAQVKGWITDAWQRSGSTNPVAVCPSASRWQFGRRDLWTGNAGNLNHPTPTAYELIGNNMASFMVGGNTEPKFGFGFDDVEWGIPNMDAFNFLRFGVDGNVFNMSFTLQLTGGVGSGTLCNLRSNAAGVAGLTNLQFNKACAGFMHDTTTPIIVNSRNFYNPTAGQMNPPCSLDWNYQNWNQTASSSSPKFLFFEATLPWGY